MLLLYTTDIDVKMFADSINNIVCEQINALQTRICSNRQSKLDHNYVDNSMRNDIVLSAVIIHFLSNHDQTLLQLKFNMNKKRTLDLWSDLLNRTKFKRLLKDLIL